MNDKYADFVNRNKPGYRADMRHLITGFVNEIVEFADLHHVDREATTMEIGNMLRMIPCYVDLAEYPACGSEVEEGANE